VTDALKHTACFRGLEVSSILNLCTSLLNCDISRALVLLLDLSYSAASFSFSLRSACCNVEAIVPFNATYKAVVLPTLEPCRVS
jgi:hypothetical protein